MASSWLSGGSSALWLSLVCSMPVSTLSSPGAYLWTFQDHPQYWQCFTFVQCRYFRSRSLLAHVSRGLPLFRFSTERWVCVSLSQWNYGTRGHRIFDLPLHQARLRRRRQGGNRRITICRSWVSLELPSSCRSLWLTTYVHCVECTYSQPSSKRLMEQLLKLLTLYSTRNSLWSESTSTKSLCKLELTRSFRLAASVDLVQSGKHSFSMSISALLSRRWVEIFLHFFQC